MACISIALGGLGGIAFADDTANLPNNVPAGYVGKPEKGSPQVIPGVIQAIDYDTAPQATGDVTFSYHGKAVKTKYRTNADSIGIAGFGQGHVSTAGTPENPDQVYVGWTQANEWLKYTVRVNETGTYVIGAKCSAGSKGATLTFSFSSTPEVTTGEIEIPTTAGFQPGKEVYHVWETLDHLGDITLPAGTYVMTVKIGKIAGMNLESFSFTKKS